MSTLLPVPDVVPHLVKRGCQKTRSDTKHCACAKANLPCTDMCRCMDSELCANTVAHQESDASGEDDERENDECDDDEDTENIYFD